MTVLVNKEVKIYFVMDFLYYDLSWKTKRNRLVKFAERY